MTFRYLLPLLLIFILSPYASLTRASLDTIFANIDQPNRICLGDGTSGFTCSDVSADTNSSEGVALGDVNGDTFLDAVFANIDQPNRICLGDGAGGFTCSDVSADTNDSSSVALGDVNGDTFLDTVFADSGPFPITEVIGEQNQICLGDGTGDFTCSDVSTDTNDSFGVALGDVNGDTFLDAVFANFFDSNRICLGDGMGGFTCSDVSADTNDSSGVALGDVNGDTFLDAVFANFGPIFLPSIGERNRICLGDGMGGFTCSDVSADTNSSEGVALDDVNGDTFPDAVFANFDQPNRICLGDGAGGFTCSDVSADTNDSFEVALGDVNGDTFPDAVFANNFSDSNRVCLGDGAGGFTCSDVSADTDDSSGVALGEVDKATVVAAVLPSSRSVQVGNTATAFATITNASEVAANDCGISPITSVTANFTYQTTDPVTNALTGTPDTPANIAPGQSQSFVFAFTPTTAFPSTEIQLSFDCSNSDPAPIITGVNTLLLSASDTAIPDIVALVATLSNDGIVNIPGATGTGVLAVATVNVGIGGQITATADTGGVSLPLSLSICETDPITSTCLSEPGDAVISTIAESTTSSFAVFVAGTGNVPFDPANNRIFVRFRDSDDIIRGSTSVAVRTQ